MTHAHPLFRERLQQARRWLFVALAILLPGLLATAATATVVRLSAGPTREVVIETNDPQIEVVVQGERIVRIVDPRTGRVYQLERDNLTLSQVNDPNGLLVTLDGQRAIVLRREGQQIATVRLEKKRALAGEEQAAQRTETKVTVAAGRTQVRFLRPAGMKVEWSTPLPSGKTTAAPGPIVVPGRYNFAQAAIYRLKLSNIDNHPGRKLYPTLEVVPANPKTEAFLAHAAVPVSFTREDLRQMIAGNYVVKVIYLPDPQSENGDTVGPEEIISTQLEPGLDPIKEAIRRGRILLVVRMGNADQLPQRSERTPTQVQIDLAVAELQAPPAQRLAFAALDWSQGKLARILGDQARFTNDLDKLRTQGVAKILAAPRLLTLSGRPASFLTGGQTPVSSTGADGVRAVRFELTGIQINCLPTVLGQDRIQLEIEGEMAVPGFDGQRLYSAVTLPSNKSVALAVRGQAQAGSKNTTRDWLILVTPRLLAALPDRELPRPFSGQPHATPLILNPFRKASSNRPAHD